MTKPKKIIVTSKKNLQTKYGSDFSAVDKLLRDLAAADSKRDLDTTIVYIDDSASVKKVGIPAVASVTRRSAKKAVDDIYKKHLPAYLVIFGSQDIIPFQELRNPVPYDPDEDADQVVPSDLPYACDAPYSLDISSFTGPSRVIGRIPDITGKADLAYVKTVIDAIIAHKTLKEDKFLDYFSVTADVWKKSTQQSLSNIFGNSGNLLNCPPSTISYSASAVKPLIHFYNCHGSPVDSKFYGQKGNSYPTAMESTDLKNKVSVGAVVAAECCYGAELYNPANEGNKQLGIANTYLGNKAAAFVGSSTIAYGPADGQGLADLITQYFVKNVLSGASTGRAFLEAQQKFLSVSATLDPYEMKTLGQFYLLGDPSLKPVTDEMMKSGKETLENHRLNLSKKGLDLSKNVEVSKEVEFTTAKAKKMVSGDLKNILKETDFTGNEKQYLFEVEPKEKKVATLTKGIVGNKDITFRTFVKEANAAKKSKNVGKALNLSDEEKNLNIFSILILKEGGGKLLGWRIYHSK